MNNFFIDLNTIHIDEIMKIDEYPSNKIEYILL